jgi:hypothetical protein
VRSPPPPTPVVAFRRHTLFKVTRLALVLPTTTTTTITTTTTTATTIVIVAVAVAVVTAIAGLHEVAPPPEAGRCPRLLGRGIHRLRELLPLFAHKVHPDMTRHTQLPTPQGVLLEPQARKHHEQALSHVVHQLGARFK